MKSWEATQFMPKLQRLIGQVVKNTNVEKSDTYLDLKSLMPTITQLGES